MNTGRWTKFEHDLFVKALDMYGKNWHCISLFVATRTQLQCRTHAQKYFLRLRKQQDRKHWKHRSQHIHPCKVQKTLNAPTNTDVQKAVNVLVRLSSM